MSSPIKEKNAQSVCACHSNGGGGFNRHTQLAMPSSAEVRNTVTTCPVGQRFERIMKPPRPSRVAHCLVLARCCRLGINPLLAPFPSEEPMCGHSLFFRNGDGGVCFFLLCSFASRRLVKLPVAMYIYKRILFVITDPCLSPFLSCLFSWILKRKKRKE